MNIYVISDTHFFHTNIIKYCFRPYSTIELQDSALISNWNSTVGKEDLVIHLGDIAFSKNAPALIEIIKKLNGRKVLVQGNHDKRSRHWYLSNGFDFICDSFVWDNIIFTHRPISRENIDRWRLNIHGHIHEKLEKDKRFVNISVEQIKYTPIKLLKVIDNALKGAKK